MNMDFLVNHFFYLLNSSPKNLFKYAMFMLGFRVAFREVLWKPLYGIYSNFLRPRRNLVRRYGTNWAFVTGASDGIGEALCYELAKSGFNIVLVGRSMDKLKTVEANLNNYYKVQTKIVVYDFV